MMRRSDPMVRSKEQMPGPSSQAEKGHDDHDDAYGDHDPHDFHDG